MKKYYRIMLGAKGKFADDCYKNQFIGVDYTIDVDLSDKLSDDLYAFNAQFIPLWLDKNPGKNKVSAGLSCSSLWKIAKGINIGDIVISPNGQGSYYIGEVISNYSYNGASPLPHQRKVKWYDNNIDRNKMSYELKNTTMSLNTVCEITKYAGELDTFINGDGPVITVNDDTIEEPSEFALEKHLEEFLIKNWNQTELGKNYMIFEEDGEIVGQQYPTDTGYIDILAISNDKKDLLVVELKKGRASDNVVGQILRYMGDVKRNLAEDNQTVKGVIIAHEDDNKIKSALSVTNNIDFYKYQIKFNLIKV